MAAIAVYLGRGMTPDNAAYYLSRRGPQMIAMLTGGIALGVAAVVFQSVTQNRLLTPSVLGIDSLFVLFQTAVVFFSGADALIVTNPRVSFVVGVLGLTLFAHTMLRILFLNHEHGMAHVLLVGVVMGLLFRSVTGFLQMIINPNEFTIVQDSVFASVNNVRSGAIGLAVIVTALSTAFIAVKHRSLDVLSLGRSHAIGLGVEYRRTSVALMTAASLQVAGATALIGPIPFLGLVGANAARELVPAWHHRTLLPTAALVGTALLVGVELTRQLADIEIPLGNLLKLVGGITFIAILIRGGRR